ncbi:hypothetical protein R1flu_023929 [Riccia fluitans]|uniref:Uncharacterized protein n=1 Tax=Riccia fluitans TaxID=41844 RepID=A0ABD1XTK8_9MARC
MDDARGDEGHLAKKEILLCLKDKDKDKEKERERERRKDKDKDKDEERDKDKEKSKGEKETIQDRSETGNNHVHKEEKKSLTK